jgi:hypothetical protein
MLDWNIPATAALERGRDLLQELNQWAEFRRPGFGGILIGRVADVNDFLMRRPKPLAQLALFQADDEPSSEGHLLSLIIRHTCRLTAAHDAFAFEPPPLTRDHGTLSFTPSPVVIQHDPIMRHA